MEKSSFSPLMFDDLESRFAFSLSDVKYVPLLGVSQRVGPYEVEDKNI
jgi:hypothetical protein